MTGGAGGGEVEAFLLSAGEKQAYAYAEFFYICNRKGTDMYFC